MKNQISGWTVIGYIFAMFLCCFAAFMVAIQVFNDENCVYIFEIPTMGAFVIGAVYLFGGNQTEEDSAELPEHKDNDEADK